MMKPVIFGDYNAEILDANKFNYIKDILDLKHAEKIPFFVICSDDRHIIEHCIYELRRSLIPKVYLKPVYLVKCGVIPDELYYDKVFDESVAMADYDVSVFKNFVHHAEMINNAIAKLPDTDKPVDNYFAIKVLRYMYTRKCELIPFRSSVSYLGYTYPCIDFFQEKVDHKQILLLEFLEEHQLVEEEFVDSRFSCVNCSSGFIHFKEICPKCGSSNIRSSEMIHHFRCAYVGPVEDFKKGDKLVCPKCKRTLKLIGNDYEKPSCMHKCQDCHAVFQEPDIKTICFNCGQESIPDNLHQIEINRYSLSAIASSTVLHGIRHVFLHDLERNIDLVKYGSFIKYLQIEIERIKRYKQFRSTLCLLQMKKIDEMLLSIGLKTTAFVEEFAEVINNTLRRSDLISLYGNSSFLLLLTHTAKANADKMFIRGEKPFHDLLKQNLDTDVEFNFQYMELDGNKSAEQIVKELAGRCSS